MNDWKVLSKSGKEMMLVRGMALKTLSCSGNRVGSRIFATANPGQIFDETTIELLLTDYSIQKLCACLPGLNKAQKIAEYQRSSARTI